jgi:hypothetical protein
MPLFAVFRAALIPTVNFGTRMPKRFLPSDVPSDVPSKNLLESRRDMQVKLQTT